MLVKDLQPLNSRHKSTRDRTAFLLLWCVLVGGCDSSGTSGSPSGSLSPSVELAGTTLSINIEVDDATDRVLTIGASEEQIGELEMFRDADGFTAVAIVSGDDLIVFDSTDGASISSDGLLTTLASADGEIISLVANADRYGFEYQRFGTWIDGFGDTNANLGVGSFGVETTPSQRPTGSATFNGASSGFSVRNGDVLFLTTSDIAISTDFSSISIESSNTGAVDLRSGDVSSAPDLDFVGTGNIVGSAFEFSISGPDLTGRLDGSFFGPAAEEVGGTFEANGNNTFYVGAFGAE